MINYKKILKLFFITTPFILGVIGYLDLPDMKVSSALYSAIRLYTFNTDTSEINILIEIARWSAPIVTMSVVLYSIKDLWYRLIYYLRSFKKNSCSVYGDSKDAIHFLNSLNSDGIKGDFLKIRSSKYHVFFTSNIKDVIEITNNKSIKRLIEDKSKGYQFIFRVPWDSKISFKCGDIHTFSNEENNSIKYWEKNLASEKEKIALIGSKVFCEAILDKGLQLNIFSEKQNIEYHIWSDIQYDKTRIYLKDALAMTGDEVRVYKDNWECSLQSLEEMDRVIVACEKSDNLAIGVKLLNSLPKSKIHVYSKYDVDVNDLFENNRIICFGKMNDVINRDVIIKESLRTTAKKIHQYFLQSYPVIPEWEKLSDFHVNSNISAATYFKVIEKLYKEGSSKECLVKLEHIRWCRFHYLQNWRYGKEKDLDKKTHPCLIPYEKLSMEEKNKDMENVDLALKFAGLIE